MASSGVKLISALRKAKSRSSLQGIPEAFFNDEELTAFNWLCEFVTQHQAWPTPQTFRKETGITTVTTNEPLPYYVNDCRKKALWQALFEPFGEMRNFMEDKEPDRFIELAKRAVELSNSMSSVTHEGLTTLATGAGLIREDYRIAKATAGLRGIDTGHPFLNEATDGFQKANLYTVVARTGVGKALGMDERILMADGSWRKNRDLSVGDKLASIDGDANVINAVYPQGKRPAYIVKFSDGREVVADLDHLWKVRMSTRVEQDRLVTTRQLIVALKAKRNKGRITIPIVSGEFGHNDWLPIHPWLLGALLGDGCLRASEPRFTSADPELIQRVKKFLPGGMEVKFIKNYDYTLGAGAWGRNPLKKSLQDLQLWGCGSFEKSIPEAYLSAKREVRLAILQGLMDTDGYVNETGSIDYCSVSPRLAHQIQHLVRSIGGLASIKEKKTSGQLAYMVRIRIRDGKELFTLQRKKDRAQSSNQYSDNLGPKLISIECCGMEEMQCISVSHPSKLFVTNDYIVTHNTWLLLNMAQAARQAGYSVLFLSAEMGVLQVARRLFGLQTRINPNFIRSGRLSTRVEAEMQGQLASMENDDGPPFYWLAGNFKKTVPALHIAVNETQADIVFADASYLLKAADRTKFNARHELLNDVMEGIHNICTESDRPVIQSVQFNRTATKPKRGEGDDNDEGGRYNPVSHLDLTKIGGTDTIGQISSVVLGLATGDPPHERDRRYAGLLKGREGEFGWYEYKYEFSPVDFSQVRTHYEARDALGNEPPPDLSYMDETA